MSRTYQAKQYSFPRSYVPRTPTISPLTMEVKDLGKYQIETNKLLRSVVQILYKGLQINERSLKLLEEEYSSYQSEQDEPSGGIEAEDKDDQVETV